ncbi:hypothetical protein ACWEO2_43135 [Nocardia sp. NPDC004278]
MTKEAHKLWIEGRFRESKAEGDARRCANNPKPTKGYGELPLGTGLGDPLHKAPSEGLIGVVAEITFRRGPITLDTPFQVIEAIPNVHRGAGPRRFRR